jgi:hypothetical protein
VVERGRAEGVYSAGDMSNYRNYDVGTRAWQQDPTEGWVASEVTKKTVNGESVKLVFTLENGEVSMRS